MKAHERAMLLMENKPGIYAINNQITGSRAKAIHNSRTNPARKELQRSIALANWENPETRAKAIENLNAGRIAINDRKKANAKAKREQQ